MRRSHPRIARAFTLVELLVVISILALLIAILLPSLRRARVQAKRVVCGSNLHQLGAAFEMYADAHGDRYPAWSNWHLWGYFRTPLDGTGTDSPGPAWTERLRDEGSLPGIEIYRCPAYPDPVAVSYFVAAYADFERRQQNSIRRGWIRYAAEYVVAGDCTNPMFFAVPYGTHPTARPEDSDADMDNATQRGLDWDHRVHGDAVNNVLFSDTHVSPFSRFDPAAMTHDTVQRAVDWGELEL